VPQAGGGSGSAAWSVSGDHIHPNSPSGGNAGVRAFASGDTAFNLYVETNAEDQVAVYGRGVNAGTDGVGGRATTTGGLGVYGRNDNTTGTAVGGTNISTGLYTLQVGSGGAFTGRTYGVFGKGTYWNYDQAGGGYFEHDDGTASVFSHIASWNSLGYGYRCIGNGDCALTSYTRDGPKALVSVTMPEPRVEDIGRGRLQDGHCRVEFDPLFLDCVESGQDSPCEVFIQLRDDCNGVYVRTDATGFDVRELNGGKTAAEFSYRVSAVRNGARNRRFAPALERVDSHSTHDQE